MPRRLDPDEAALWARVISTIRPLHRKATTSVETAPAKALLKANPSGRAISQRPAPPVSSSQKPAANTLDGSWDRRIAAGRIVPDMTVDLHGHNLISAHALLERRLAEAITTGDRVMLVITGRPPRPDQDPDRPRGLIRQQILHWLATSPHRSAIAAVRGAHPRHGGAGALYLVLRRPREGKTIL